VGGISGWLMDIGIDDNFIKQLKSTNLAIPRYLFGFKKVTPDKVLNHLKQQNV
jgi:uncharacterized membrane protein